jgi:uncharacterized protein (TIGR03437 family)
MPGRGLFVLVGVPMSVLNRSVAFFLCLVVTSTACAESFSLPRSAVNSLSSAARLFRSKKRVKTVSVTIPFPNGRKKFHIIPHDLRGRYYSEAASDRGSVRSTDQQVDLFRTRSETADQFLRLTLVTQGQKITSVFGFAKSGGHYYDITGDKKPSRKSKRAIALRIRGKEASEVAYSCGADSSSNTGSEAHAPRMLSEDSKATNPVHAAAQASLKVARIATEADYEYTKLAGGAAQANAKILSILNGVDAIFRSEFGVTLQVIFQNAWDTPSDPYVGISSDSVLREFTSYWNSNYRYKQNYTLAHIWTDKWDGTDIAGRAWEAQLCGNLPYGMSIRAKSLLYDVAIAAHEIGHVFGASHDFGSTEYLMGTPLNVNATKFSPYSHSQINSHMRARSSCFGNLLTSSTSVNPNGVVDAATFKQEIAPGGLISIFGTDLSSSVCSATSIPLPKVACGTEVVIAGQAVPLLYVSPTQINAQLPAEIQPGAANLLVQSALGASAPVSAQVLPHAPRIFSQNQSGVGLGSIQFSKTGVNLTDDNPATEGDELTIWGTGFGAGEPPVPTGSPPFVPTPNVSSKHEVPARANLDGKDAPVLFSGKSPEFVGVDQINVRVPPGLGSGRKSLQLCQGDRCSNTVEIPLK